ncbi:MAG: TfoX/Sxy family protein [Methylococcus sp.]|nr:TfoX/Sxy family protein [Methylococcus sp.]
MPFSPSEREVLLAVRGVGPTVIARLEQLGLSSLRQLAIADATSILHDAAALAGSSCWKNSPQARAAIESAIAAAIQATSLAAAAPSDGSSPAEILAVEELRRLANLGPKSAATLAAAGVRSFEHLRQLGSVAAFMLAKRSGAKISLNLLWALEGALSDQPWQVVAREHRASLLLSLEACERGGDES